MKRPSLLILVFSITFLVFFMLPPFLNHKFGFYPLMKVADVFDLFTPLVLIPLYWLIYRLDGKSAPTQGEDICFMILAAFWVLGQGMHLAANSIGHLLNGMEGTDIYKLSHFYDEVLSHYLWHFGVVGLSAILIFRQWRKPLAEERISTWLVILAGIIYGFTYFSLIIEGATTPLGVTFTVLAVFLIAIYARKVMIKQPVIFFFFIAYAFALLLFIGWGIYWQGLPEFSEVGIIG
jgi:hypothetical protein